MAEQGVGRRAVLKGVVLGAGGLVLPAGLARGSDESSYVTLESYDDLHCVYINRMTGRVELVKSFAEVHPEILEEITAKPYKAPSGPVYVGRTGAVFKGDIQRFGIVDIEKRNATLGWFSRLKDAYTPEEYNLHYLLTLSDREMGREGLGEWALDRISAARKEAAFALMERVHSGYNGQIIMDDPEKRLEAERYYAGRESLKPALYVGMRPDVGDLAMVGSRGIELASLAAVQLAQATGGQVSGGVGVGEGIAEAVSAAAEGATQGSSATGAAVGATASVGASSEGDSAAGDGGSDTGVSGGGGSGGF